MARIKTRQFGTKSMFSAYVKTEEGCCIVHTSKATSAKVAALSLLKGNKLFFSNSKEQIVHVVSSQYYHTFIVNLNKRTRSTWKVSSHTRAPISRATKIDAKNNL